MRRFVVGLLVFLSLSFALTLIGISGQLQVRPDSENAQALPFVYVFYSITILMSPYSSFLQNNLVMSPELVPVALLSWAPFAIWLLASFVSGAIVGDVGKSFKLSMTCVLILMILWLPAAMISLKLFVPSEVARMIFLDRMIAEFVLRRPMDLVLVFLVPAVSSAMGASIFGRFGRSETELQPAEWVIPE